MAGRGLAQTAAGASDDDYFSGNIVAHALNLIVTG
jgi:hypothetical protein